MKVHIQRGELTLEVEVSEAAEVQVLFQLVERLLFPALPSETLAPGVGAKAQLYLRDYGKTKIQVIRVVRQALALGLAEAKGLVERAPVIISTEQLTPEAHKAFRQELVAVGATVE